MVKDRQKLKGKITVTVLDKNGDVKEFRRSLWRRMFNLPAKKMEFRHHNTITNQGDGLIADWMISSPTQNKVDATNGYMAVGTGWTGASTKANTGVNAITGSYQKLDSGYPKKQGGVRLFGAECRFVPLFFFGWVAFGERNKRGRSYERQQRFGILPGLRSDYACGQHHERGHASSRLADNCKRIVNAPLTMKITLRVNEDCSSSK